MIETRTSKSFAESETSLRLGQADRSEHVEASTAGGNNVIAWLNLLCLDAPLVAVSWQWLFARSFRIPIPAGTTLALFLTAWLIYLADRFGDNLSLDRHDPMSLRQRFCFRHRRAWLVLVAIIALADLGVVVTKLDTRAITIGAIIGMLAFLYLLANQLRPAIWHVLPLKEISIGFIFAAGAMVGLVRGLTSAALPVWVAFACLCSLNCISIAVWERDLDEAQRRTSIATAFPKIERFLLPMFVLLLAVCLGQALVRQTALVINLSLAASASLLAIVHVFRKTIPSDIRTALADLAMLTPLIFGWWCSGGL